MIRRLIARQPATPRKGDARRTVTVDVAEIVIESHDASLVQAEVRLAVGAAGEAPMQRGETLLAAAGELIACGLLSGTDGRSSGAPVETSIRQFRNGREAAITAVARCLSTRHAISVWEVTFTGRHDDRSPIAVVTQTLALEPWTPDGAPPFAAGDAAGLAEPQAGGAPRQESSAASTKRSRIEAAAAEIIARKGFAAASIREIADAAGMHVPTLYQYVGSKDELLELVYSHTMAALKADLEAELVASATAEQRLETAIRILVGRGDRFRQRIGLLNRELRSLTPTARARVLSQYRDLMGSTAEIIRLGMGSGEFRPVDPEIVANLVDGACDMWALRRFSLGHVGMETFRSEITKILLRGLLSVTTCPPS